MVATSTNHRLVRGVILYMEAMDRSGTQAAIAAADRQLETALVELAQQGDESAFADLVDLRLAPTLRSVTAILGNESDARDTTQLIFVRAWKHLPTLRDPASFGAWFGRIVVNASRTSIRSRRSRIVREISVGTFVDGDESLVVDQLPHEQRTEMLDVLERAFDRLAPADRLILWLHHYEDLSLVEIGERLGVPAKTVKSRLYTARRALESAIALEER